MIGFVVTDRFLELFAFGGLLQAAAVMFRRLTVVAFVRAARDPRWSGAGGWQAWRAGPRRRSRMSATGMIAVPVGLFAAALAIIPRRNLGWRDLRIACSRWCIGLGAIGVYWLLVLLPASTRLRHEPRQPGYRGPDRLFSSLFVLLADRHCRS